MRGKRAINVVCLLSTSLDAGETTVNQVIYAYGAYILMGIVYTFFKEAKTSAIIIF